jgi:hypothetical protein
MPSANKKNTRREKNHGFWKHAVARKFDRQAMFVEFCSPRNRGLLFGLAIAVVYCVTQSTVGEKPMVRCRDSPWPYIRHPRGFGPVHFNANKEMDVEACIDHQRK